MLTAALIASMVVASIGLGEANMEGDTGDMWSFGLLLSLAILAFALR